MNMDMNRFGNFNQTKVLEFAMQQYKVYIVKSQNLLHTIETNYMYFLIHTVQTVGGHDFEEVIDFHFTQLPDDIWSYALTSHIGHVPDQDDQLIEAMMHEIDALIS